MTREEELAAIEAHLAEKGVAVLPTVNDQDRIVERFMFNRPNIRQATNRQWKRTGRKAKT